jgi:hypothetical protein
MHPTKTKIIYCKDKKRKGTYPNARHAVDDSRIETSSHQTQLSLQDIVRQLNPLQRGWIEYYGRYASSALYPLLLHINQMLVAWVLRKFKRFKGHTVRASQFLQRLAKDALRTLGYRHDRSV